MKRPEGAQQRMTSRHDIEAVFVGVATLDAIALVPSFPGPDERLVADEVSYAGGGPAATSAVAAARLGVRTAFVGTVGDDANGRAVLAGLEAEGVDVTGVTVAAGESTAASVVIVDRSRGTRAICNRPAPRIDVSAGADLIAARSARPRRPRRLGAGAPRRARPRPGRPVRRRRQPDPGLRPPRGRPLRADRRGTAPPPRGVAPGRRAARGEHRTGLPRRRGHRRLTRVVCVDRGR